MFQTSQWLGKEWRICGNKTIHKGIKIESLVKYKKGKLIVSFDINDPRFVSFNFNNTYFYVEHKVES
jgi:hypothetical protein